MNSVLNTIGFLLLGLIKIGDSVLWLWSKTIIFIRHIQSNINKQIKKVQKRYKSYRFSFSLSKILKKREILLFSAKKARAKKSLTNPFYTLKQSLTKQGVSISNNLKIAGQSMVKTFLQVIEILGKTLRQAFLSVTKVFHLPKRTFQPTLRKRGRPPKTLMYFPLPFFVKFRYFIAGITFSLIFVFIPLLVLLFLQDLPNPRTLTLSQSAQTTKIFDRNGKLLYQIYANQNRTVIPLSVVPQYLQDATIAIEDKNFYKHPGFDLSAIIRSTVENLSGKDLQGGSTITQQLIKSSLLTPETSITRKVKEVVLAFWTERLYSKHQILELYFNQVPYGGTSWGVESAAQTYFGKSVKDLDLAQSAFLAGIPRGPTIYSPYGQTPTAWKKRQKEVLYRMSELGYITKKQSEEAAAEELVFLTPQTPIHAPHFVMFVKDWLVKKYGLPAVEKGGLTVVTSLDLSLQETAQKIVTDEVAANANLSIGNGAALITRPGTGEILAMIGSKDYNDPTVGNFNVTTALRQPGSSIKVVTYAAALEHGMTAATIVDDSAGSFSTGGGPAYTPVNYDGKFHGKVPLRLALGNSFNLPAVRTLNQVGIPTMVNLGKLMGIKSWGDPSQYGLAVTLGGSETTMVDMTTVFATLANQGVRVDLNPILKVTDPKGLVLEELGEPQGKRVLDAGNAFILADILTDNSARVMEFGANSALVIPGRTVSVKTGTSDWKKDNWTFGFTKDYVVATWVGNNDGMPMNQYLASGITGAAPMWHKLMVTVLGDSPDVRPTPPDNVIQKSCYGRMEYFVRGTENTVNCNYVPPKITPTPTPKKT